MSTYHKIRNVYRRSEDDHLITRSLGFQRPVFEFLENAAWDFTEKVDGMNMRAVFDGEGGFRVAGKSDRAQIPGDLNDHMYDVFAGFDAEFEFEGRPVTFYGEGYGAGIQKGGSYSQEKRFILFDIRVDQRWLSRSLVLAFSGILNIPVVPLLFTGTLSEGVRFAAHGFSSEVAETEMEAEGLIGKPTVELFDEYGERVIVKLKGKDFR